MSRITDTSGLRAAALALVTLTVGCTYPGIREFADLSAAASNQLEFIASDYQASQVRVDAIREALGKEPLGGVTSNGEVDAMIQVQLVLSAYLEALATLASDEVVSYRSELGGLSNRLQEVGAIDEAKASAFAHMGELAAEAITGWFRHRELKKLLPCVNKDVATLTVFLADTAAAYEQQLEEELLAVKSVATSNAASATEIAAYHTELRTRQDLAREFSASMAEVALRHAQLAEHPGDLDEERVLEFIREFREAQAPRDRNMNRRRPGGRVAARPARNAIDGGARR